MIADGFIDLAGKLVASESLGDKEARFRTAIGRAYYGAFHLCSSFLDQVGAPIAANHLGHQQAYERLLASGNTDVVSAARILDDLRKERIRADYRSKAAGFDQQKNAMQCVEMAHRLRSALVRSTASNAINTIATSIAEWRGRTGR